MSYLKDEICIDKDFCKEINYQLELLFKLKHENLTDMSLPSSKLDQENLSALQKSLRKLDENEIFFHNLKTNQVK
jgi:hypothetical protein